MDTVTRVKNAGSPQDALVALAQAIDNVYTKLDQLTDPDPAPADPWGEWSNDGPDVPEEYTEGETVVTFDDDGNAEVELPEVSAEKKKLRQEFAAGIFQSEELIDAYVEGGPMWLYIYDRDFVMGLPEESRRIMVADWEAINPKEALQMGRDILKDKSPGGIPDRWVSANTTN